MPGRHSLFWPMAGLLAVAWAIVIALSWNGGQHISRELSDLSDEARTALTAYAAEAEQVAASGDRAAVDAWLLDMRRREPGSWVAVVDDYLRPLSNRVMTRAERSYLRFQQGLDRPVHYGGARPVIGVDFPGDPQAGRLVIELPERFMLGKSRLYWWLLLHGVLPVLCGLLLGALLYRQLMRPLRTLERNAERLSDDLSARVPAELTARRDEFGELGRAFDGMAARLERTLVTQRRLLKDMSHELRTPLSRLRVAAESDLDSTELRRRLEREVQGMQTLIDNALDLVWTDMEDRRAVTEPVEMRPLWALLVEDACFESGWDAARMPCSLPEDCAVQGDLNSLARALENLLRNAIRHSPAAGTVALGGTLEGAHWHLWLQDQGPGVPEPELEHIFHPFVRLDGARPGDGFGLGLSIVRRAIEQQGGRVWAENSWPGLRLHIVLPAADTARRGAAESGADAPV